MHPHGQEQVDINTVLGLYRTKLAEANEAIIMMEARLLQRDQTIAELRGQGEREIPDTPYN